MANGLAALPLIAALLLAGAGLAKVVKPESATSGLVAVGIPISSFMVRVGALLEVVVALGNVFTSSVGARACLVASYLGFAIYLNVARKSPAVSSCGCFGDRGAPPSLRQVLVDLVIALGCAVSTALGSPSLVVLWSTSVVHAGITVCLCALGAWLLTFVLDTPLRGDLT
jgi:hypothetical protein